MIKKILLFGLVMLLSVAAIGQNKRVRGNYVGPAYAGLAVVIDTAGYTVVDSSATPAIQTDSVFQGAMLQYDTTNGWESVDRAAVLGYKEYVAILSQSGTDAPTVDTVLYNDIGNIVWTYVGIGDYSGTLAGAFPENKVVIFLGGVGTDDNSLTGANSRAARGNDNFVKITTYAIASIDFSGEEVIAGFANYVLGSTPITIRVYN